MYWNYRVVQVGEVYSIEEVYYDEYGNPRGYCDADPVGDTLDGLREVLHMMEVALDKPVLSESDFGGE